MECFQPTGSFKARGIGHRCLKAVGSGQNHLISSSGGNAGYTAAYAGRLLGARVTVVVPENASAKARERIAAEGAAVIVHGRYWDEADLLAREMVSETGAAYIHPFDHADIWRGHSSMVRELAHQCPLKPEAVVVAVGGGGLLCGMAEGMLEVGWDEPPLLAVETEGAASFAAAVSAGELVRLTAITSIASTLGALQVTPQALDWAARRPIRSIVVSDAEAVSACLRFADDMRVLVEPACGAALSLLYDRADALAEFSSVVVVVCGGAGITWSELQAYAAGRRD
jgi:L-serine/L-threonine ammonia-lyase